MRQAREAAPGPFERALAPSVEALLLAARGELDQAETLARDGIAIGETETENLWLQAWGYEDLAGVLKRSGCLDEVRFALDRALVLARRKGCLPYANRLREQLDSLGHVEG